MSLYAPGTDTALHSHEAEVRCRDCEHIFWTTATEHLGALDLHEDSCPECGGEDLDLLGLE